MSLLAPLWLGLLLLGGWVLYLHWTRRSQRHQRVSSLWIWQQLAPRISATRRSRPPMASWALFLQLLTVTVVALALARPWWGPPPAVGNYLFVLENSLAMQGRPGSQQPTHLDAARQAMDQQIRDLPAGSRIWLLVAGSRPYWLAHGWRQPADVQQALATLAADWGHANWLQAHSLILEAQPLLEGAHTLVFSPSANPFKNPGFLARLTQQTPEKTGLNRAIRSVRWLEPLPGQPFWKIEGQIQANQPGGQITLETWTRPLGSQLFQRVDRQEINLSGLDRAAFRVNLLVDQPVAVEMRIPEDSLNPDNQYRLILRPAHKRRVGWIGPRSEVLEKALLASRPLQVDYLQASGKDLPSYDLTIVNRVTPAHHPVGSVLWIAADLKDLPPVQPVDASLPGTAHRLGRGINWERLEVPTAHPIQRQTGAEVVLGTPDQPLIQARTTELGREVWLAFSPEDTNWPGQPDLPAFLDNLLTWSEPQPRSPCWAGQPCPWPASRYLKAVELWLNGQRLSTVEQAGQPTGNSDPPQFWIRDELAQDWYPLRSGFYQLRWGGLQQEIAVNVSPLSAEISMQDSLTSGSSTIPLGLPLWFWLLGIALLVGGLELLWQGYSREGLGVMGWRAPGGGLGRNGWILTCYLVSGVLLILSMVNPMLPLPARVLASLRLVEDSASIPTDWPRGGLLEVSHDLGMALQQATAWAPYPLEIGVAAQGLAPHSELGILALQLVQARHQLRFDPIPAEVIREPYLTALKSPQKPQPQQPFLLEAFLYSPATLSRQLVIAREGKPWIEQTVRLQPGVNRIEIELLENRPGWVNYQVSLRSATPSAWPVTVKVGPAPRVAILASTAQDAEAWGKLLTVQGMDVKLMTPNEPGFRLSGTPDWQTLVLVNYPARNLTPDQQQQLEQWVREEGGGLALIGGPSSFGPGGYFKTPLDQVSPVSSKVPNEAPKAALLFVVDKSGSMNQPSAAGRRIDIARAATLEAIRLLHPESLVGVIAFDTEARTWLPLQRPGNVAAFEREMGRLEPGGGTALRPALEMALELLEPVTDLSRHVILLSDGLSEVGDFEPLAHRFALKNITLSAVAVGEGSDIKLVEQLARWGGGSWYIPQNWEEIPAILAQETLLRSASPIMTTSFTPSWTATPQPFWLEGWPNALPPLNGHVKTTLKPGASLWITGPGKLPLLAHWRYGRGQVLAFTSDPLGAWSGGWSQLSQQAAMWAAALRPLGQPQPLSDARVTVRSLGPHLELTIFPGQKEADLAIHNESQPLVPTLKLGTEATRYTFRYTPQPLSPYRFQWGQQAIGFWSPPPLPADMDAAARLTSLVLASQGSVVDVLPPPRYIWRWQPQASWPLASLLALLVYLLGLGLRYRV